MSIKDNINLIKDKIRNCSKANLVVVSKTVPSEQIIEAINSDCNIFGENKIQEAKDKWPAIKSQYSNIKLHLIGHLQSNKVADAVEIFDVIQTLDSEKLADLFAKEMEKQKKVLEFFVQVNIGQELQKSGIAPDEVTSFINKVRQDYNLKITGIMAIPPVDEDPSLYFALMKKLAIENNLPNLSMGMSADFEVALAFGATHIRIGTAIFGTRPI